jgi:CheY-like chemotaxis protein
MLKILLVEDEPDALEFMALLLKQLGYEVKAALNGEEALRLLRDDCPDVVISDLVMPGMSGDQLLAEIRKLDAACPIFFILLTGHPTVSRVVDAVTRGADEVLLKPVELHKLADALLHVHERKGGA